MDLDSVPRCERDRRAARRARGHLHRPTGRDAHSHFPWAWKPSELVAVRPVELEVDDARRRQWLRIRDRVSVRIQGRYTGKETVTCVIPGHDRAGEELMADELLVEDGPLAFSYRGVCGYGGSLTTPDRPASCSPRRRNARTSSCRSASAQPARGEVRPSYGSIPLPLTGRIRHPSDTRTRGSNSHPL